MSIAVAAGLGVVTNLVTDTFSWALAAAVVALVATQVTQSVLLGRQEARERRAARDDLLGPLRPALPARPVDAPDTVSRLVHLLTAPYCPTRLWGRRTERAGLLDWCVARDPSAGVVRVLTGAAGSGKSRLALAVAEDLPDGWAAGWFLGVVDDLVQRIVAAGEPTLVIVENAERVADLDQLVLQASRHSTLVRLLLLTRFGVGPVADTVLPHVAHVVPLTALGGPGDRQRWFAEASREYAKSLGVPPPNPPERPVGQDADTPLVVHARALLAASGRAEAMTWTFAELISELMMLERRGWEAELDRLPRGCDLEVLSQAVTVLLALPARTVDEAADLLRRVPQFSADSAHESRMAVARWAHRYYPPGPDHRLDVRPDLIGERLILDTLARTDLLRDEDTAAIPTLLRIMPEFADALDVVVPWLTRRRRDLPALLPVIFGTGVVDRALDVALAELVDPDDPSMRQELITVDAPVGLRHLRVALDRCLVAHCRERAAADPSRGLPDLAVTLQRLNKGVRALGLLREALGTSREVVDLYRQLANGDPERYRPEIAGALSSFGSDLRAVGLLRDAVTASEEAVGMFRRLADDNPERYLPGLANTVNNLSVALHDLALPESALAAAEEAVRIRRRLAEADPDRYLADLATAIQNLSNALRESGRLREALAASQEVVGIRRVQANESAAFGRLDLVAALYNLNCDLRATERYQEALDAATEAVAGCRSMAEEEPTRYLPDLARVLHSLGATLTKLGRPREALETIEETARIRRRLAEAEPIRYLPDLAEAMHALGINLRELGRYGDALTASRESIVIRRRLAESEPSRHTPLLAETLTSLSITLVDLGRPLDAIATARAAVDERKKIVRMDGDRHLPYLADDLETLAFALESRGDFDDAAEIRREELAVLEECVKRDAELYEPAYRRALSRWAERERPA
ncbi:tetratricopeptide repeat protein [Amycolatopsis sp. NPDC021455]|uniref:tetratricopeptide repeat protein n=1 Tax=Amycolatopsis sp. NPDC021455 TaxID=3154901 RepID=UPI0033E7D7FE